MVIHGDYDYYGEYGDNDSDDEFTWTKLGGKLTREPSHWKKMINIFFTHNDDTPIVESKGLLWFSAHGVIGGKIPCVLVPQAGNCQHLCSDDGGDDDDNGDGDDHNNDGDGDKGSIQN